MLLDYRAPPGTSLAETDRLLQQVDAILKSVPEILPIIPGAPAPNSAGGSPRPTRGITLSISTRFPGGSVWEIMDAVRG